MENGRHPETAPLERSSFAHQARKASYEVAHQNGDDNFYRLRNLLEISSTISVGGLALEIDPRDLLQQSVRLRITDRGRYMPVAYVQLEASARTLAGDLKGARARTNELEKEPDHIETYDVINLHLANARLAASVGENPARDLGKAWRLSDKDHTLKQLERRQIAETAFNLGLNPQEYFDPIVKEVLRRALKSNLVLESLTEVAASLAKCGFLDESVNLMKHFNWERSSDIPTTNAITVARKLIDAGRVDDALEISRNSTQPFVKAKIALAIARSPHMNLNEFRSIVVGVELALEPTGWGLSRDGEVYAEWCQVARQDPMVNIPDHIIAAMNGGGFNVAEDTTEIYAKFGNVQSLLGLNPLPTFELAFQAASKIVPENPGMRSNMHIYHYYNGLVDIAANAALGRNQTAFDRALSDIKKVGEHEYATYRAALDLDRGYVVSETAQNLASQAVELAKAA